MLQQVDNSNQPAGTAAGRTGISCRRECTPWSWWITSTRSRRS